MNKHNNWVKPTVGASPHQRLTQDVMTKEKEMDDKNVDNDNTRCNSASSTPSDHWKTMGTIISLLLFVWMWHELTRPLNLNRLSGSGMFVAAVVLVLANALALSGISSKTAATRVAAVPVLLLNLGATFAYVSLLLSIIVD